MNTESYGHNTLAKSVDESDLAFCYKPRLILYSILERSVERNVGKYGVSRRAVASWRPTFETDIPR